MIIARMMGGLGNQMFCYAYARALQLEYNEDLYLDNEGYNKYKIRNYSLENLSIPDQIIDKKFLNINSFDYNKMIIVRNFYHIFFKVDKILRTNIIDRNIFSFLAKHGYFYNLDRYFHCLDRNLCKKKIKYTYGYFQSEKYFSVYKEQIKNELKVKIEPRDEENKLLSEIRTNNAVGISIRWDKDYFNSNLNVCKKDYYYKAMDIIYGRIKNPVFYIFSDRIDDVKNEFDFKYEVKYISGFKDYESLRLLYTCKHFIIANSSFSWWGSYLSDNKDKIVVAPSRWYLNTSKKPDIYLDNMILIDV